jgi:hypothetical protein
MAQPTSHISRGPKDRTRVDLEQEWEVSWWSKGFGVSVEELTAAVAKVGPLVADLDRFLLGARTETYEPLKSA